MWLSLQILFVYFLIVLSFLLYPIQDSEYATVVATPLISSSLSSLAHPGQRRGPWALEQSAQWLSCVSARVAHAAPLTPVTWLHHGNTLWACALCDKMANPLTECAVLNPRLNHCHDTTKLACHRRARYKMEWIYTRTKVSGPGSLELALVMKKKEWENALSLQI